LQIFFLIFCLNFLVLSRYHSVIRKISLMAHSERRLNVKQFEINGITYSFDERMFLTEEIKVGDPVQILKKHYGDEWRTYPGVIVQILPFEDHPAVEVVYVDTSYNSCEVKTILITEDPNNEVKLLTKAHPIIHLTKERAVDILQKKITECENDLRKAHENLAYFNKYFNSYFEEAEKLGES